MRMRIDNGFSNGGMHNITNHCLLECSVNKNLKYKSYKIYLS